MPRRSAVLGLGNACLDTLLEVERLPEAGEKIRLASTQKMPGGQVAGAMVGCARLGLDTQYLLRTGDDVAGERIRTALTSAGVGLRHGRILGGVASASAYIVCDRTGERTVLWSTSPDLAVRAEEVTPEIFAGVAALFLDGKDASASLRAAQMARSLKIPVVADLDCHYPHTAQLVPWIDHLVVPASFGAAEGQATTVITLGRDGARGRERGGEWLHAPAFLVAVVDTTGAGDGFHAGYLYGLLQDWNLAQRLRFANACGALACRAAGAQSGLPRRDEVEALLALQPA